MRFSPSKLNVLRDCPRCFYLANKEGIPRPRGIFPSLPGGLDLRLKDYYDNYRGYMPPELSILDSQGYSLFKDKDTLKKWRHWKTGLKCTINGVDLIGALDDCLTIADGSHIPLDYKSKGFPPKDNGSEYYQTQLDCYELLLRENGFKVNGEGVLVYYWPELVTADCNLVFGSQHFILECSADRAVETINKAIELLKGSMPKNSDTCEYCKYEREKRQKDIDILRG